MVQHHVVGVSMYIASRKVPYWRSVMNGRPTSMCWNFLLHFLTLHLLSAQNTEGNIAFTIHWTSLTKINSFIPSTKQFLGATIYASFFYVQQMVWCVMWYAHQISRTVTVTSSSCVWDVSCVTRLMHIGVWEIACVLELKYKTPNGKQYAYDPFLWP